MMINEGITRELTHVAYAMCTSYYLESWMYRPIRSDSIWSQFIPYRLDQQSRLSCENTFFHAWNCSKLPKERSSQPFQGLKGSPSIQGFRPIHLAVFTYIESCAWSVCQNTHRRTIFGSVSEICLCFMLMGTNETCQTINRIIMKDENRLRIVIHLIIIVTIFTMREILPGLQAHIRECKATLHAESMVDLTQSHMPMMENERTQHTHTHTNKPALQLENHVDMMSSLWYTWNLWPINWQNSLM